MKALENGWYNVGNGTIMVWDERREYVDEHGITSIVRGGAVDMTDEEIGEHKCYDSPEQAHESD